MVSELLASHSLTQLAALRLLRSSRVQQLLSDTVTHPAAMENRGSAHHTLRVGPSVEAALEECRGLCVLMCACAAPPTLAEGGTTAPARLGKAAAGSWDAQQICQVGWARRGWQKPRGNRCNDVRCDRLKSAQGMQLHSFTHRQPKLLLL
jgi:hypothetical protein